MPPKRQQPIQKPPILIKSESSDSSDAMKESSFEKELCWCMQNIQKALKSGKLSGKDNLKYKKSLSTLMSNSAPIVSKRQIMWSLFGDYRATMAKEDNKSSKSKVATNIKVEQAVPNKKSVFVKKSLVLAGTASTITAPPFKFDFPVDQSENRENNIVDDFSKIKMETTRSSVDDDDKNKQKNGDNKKFQFTLSDNSFRFNFESES